MPIDYQRALAHKITGQRTAYTETRTMLYALSIGMGRDPLDENELSFVFEGAELRVVPTMAAVLARGNIVGPLNLDMTLVLHGEQRLTVHRPLPPSGVLICDSRVVEVLDKGAGKGALVYTETDVRLEGEEQPLLTVGGTIFARGDGGFGGPAGPTPEVHGVPKRDPDFRHVTQTRADQALLYRLNGDRNPLHADPAVARRAGFPAPILHGLCSYAIACRAVLASVCDYDPTRIGSFDVRFTAPVYPGETIATEIWVDGEVVSFRCQVEERGVTSINNGRCLLRPA
ncbi:MAG: 3-alpha,7-alpha, 12-alpha-trihydroxy-5-beta-cholest-24-enoyl-CoA hydratase [Caulobacteraceae bacterium]|jgi:acyl dehydratase|nr:3-alpha,7-alpha, 12-alpha-trihydroxy-5-beta-cholest-24-enoyl-CoA hydratase [Caulobacteraceae bacterium]